MALIDLGNGKFKIQNDKTGESKIVSAEELSQYGMKAPNKIQNPLYNAIKQNPIINFLIGGASNVAQDVGAGIRNITEQPQLQQQQATADQLAKQAYATNDPQQRTALLESANKVLQGVTQESRNITRQFTPQVNQNPLLRGAVAGAEIATTATIPGLAQSGAKLVAKAPQLASMLTKKGAANATTKAAEEASGAGTKIDWVDMSTKIKNEVKSVLGDTKEVRDAINNFASFIRFSS